MLVGIVVVIMLAIALYEVPIMIRENEPGELATFSVLWTAATVLGILQAVGYPLPNPTSWFIDIAPRIVQVLARLVGW